MGASVGTVVGASVVGAAVVGTVVGAELPPQAVSMAATSASTSSIRRCFIISLLVFFCLRKAKGIISEILWFCKAKDGKEQTVEKDNYLAPSFMRGAEGRGEARVL